MNHAVIIDCVRTPIGRSSAEKGVFRDVRSDDGASPTGLEWQFVAAKVHVLLGAEAQPSRHRLAQRHSVARRRSDE